MVNQYTILTPQSFIISEECKKAAWQNGYRRFIGESDGWAEFESTTAHGTIWLAAADDQGPWFLALNHPGVIKELQVSPANFSGPGISCFLVPNLSALYAFLPRLYQLARSLPDAPLHTFNKRIAKLPKSTEAERLVIQRIGQEIFRDSLLDYWQGCCPLSGIADSALLRASHIVPWSECTDDAHRLDVHNGLLLSALWDAAFDRALVTFEDDGKPIFSSKLSPASRDFLKWQTPLKLTDQHRENLLQHRKRFFELQGT